MITGLNKIDPLGVNDIHQTVFLGDPPGPDIGTEKFQRLGFPHTLERITQNSFHKT